MWAGCIWRRRPTLGNQQTKANERTCTRKDKRAETQVCSGWLVYVQRLLLKGRPNDGSKSKMKCVNADDNGGAVGGRRTNKETKQEMEKSRHWLPNTYFSFDTLQNNIVFLASTALAHCTKQPLLLLAPASPATAADAPAGLVAADTGAVGLAFGLAVDPLHVHHWRPPAATWALTCYVPCPMHVVSAGSGNGIPTAPTAQQLKKDRPVHTLNRFTYAVHVHPTAREGAVAAALAGHLAAHVCFLGCGWVVDCLCVRACAEIAIEERQAHQFHPVDDPGHSLRFDPTRPHAID